MVDVEAKEKLRNNIRQLNSTSETAKFILHPPLSEPHPPYAENLLEVGSDCSYFDRIDDITAKKGTPHKTSTACPDFAVLDSDNTLHSKLAILCKQWGERLRLRFIGIKVLQDSLPKSALVSWLIENHHYINALLRAYDLAYDLASKHAGSGLKPLLKEYAHAVRGYETLVLQSLSKLGVSTKKVLDSSPHLITLLIGSIMRELCELDPSTVLLVSELVKPHEFTLEQVNAVSLNRFEHYKTCKHAFRPYIEFQQLASEREGDNAFEKMLSHVRRDCTEKQHLIIDKLHALKHAFDLLGTEIEAYHKDWVGMYFPRQPLSCRNL